MYRYNGFNQLVQAHADGQEVFYTYRPDGLRNSKETAGSVTKHLWDGQNIVADLTNGTVSNRYVRGTGLILTDRAGVQQYYLYNGHGDVVQLAGSTGTVTWEYDYDAFGNQRELAGYDPANDANPFRYCGEYFDRETGTVYLRARHYNPVSGRFTQEDTVRARRMNLFDPYGDYQDVELSGGKFVDWAEQQFVIDDPLSLNLYTFAHNNPITYQDPSGHSATATWAGTLWPVVVVDGPLPVGDAIYVVGLGACALVDGIIFVGSLVRASADDYEEYDDSPKQESMGKSKGKTSQNNKVQNKEFNEAVERLGNERGKPLTQDEIERLHREVTKQGYDLDDMVDAGRSLFGI